MEGLVTKCYKTSEFYLSLAAMLLTALYASGLMTGTLPLAIAGVAASVLGSLGYTVVRGAVKVAEAKSTTTVEIKPEGGP